MSGSDNQHTLTQADSARLISAVIRLEGQADDISDIKTTMRELATAFTQLAIFNERQVTDRAEIKRVFGKLDQFDKRIKDLELAEPAQKKSAEWVDKVINIVMVAVVSAVVSLVLVKQGTSPTLPLPAAQEQRK